MSLQETSNSAEIWIISVLDKDGHTFSYKVAWTGQLFVPQCAVLELEAQKDREKTAAVLLPTACCVFLLSGMALRCHLFWVLFIEKKETGLYTEFQL